ncbi:MAG: MFS transporter [Deinococcales bacterium]
MSSEVNSNTQRSAGIFEPVIQGLQRRFRWSRSYATGVLNGWFCTMGDAFLHPGIVLASFAAALSAPNWVIGLLPAIAVGGWLLPQIFVSAAVRHIPRKVDVYRAASVVRTTALTTIVLSTVLFSGVPQLLLSAFLLALIANSLASGVSGLPWLESVGKTISAKDRPGFFGMRNLWGGLLALGAGFAIRAILSSSLTFPWDYALIFALGAITFSLGYWFFGLSDEPPDDPPQPRAANIWADLLAIPQTIKNNPDFAKYVFYRVLFASATIGDAFFTAHALRNVGVGKEAIGTFLIAVGIIAPLSNTIWSRTAQAFGSRRIIRIALGFTFAAPLLALLMPKGAGLFFVLVFVAQSIGHAGINLGNANYILSLTSTETRGKFIGTANTLVGIAVFTPIFGGQIADSAGYLPVFALSAVLYGLTYWAAGQLRRDL